MELIGPGRRWARRRLTNVTGHRYASSDEDECLSLVSGKSCGKVGHTSVRLYQTVSKMHCRHTRCPSRPRRRHLLAPCYPTIPHPTLPPRRRRHAAGDWRATPELHAPESLGACIFSHKGLATSHILGLRSPGSTFAIGIQSVLPPPACASCTCCRCCCASCLAPPRPHLALALEVSSCPLCPHDASPRQALSPSPPPWASCPDFGTRLATRDSQALTYGHSSPSCPSSAQETHDDCTTHVDIARPAFPPDFRGADGRMGRLGASLGTTRAGLDATLAPRASTEASS